ncbi:MAG: undecaprenyl-diphosphate phosphatase [Spirochaetia bacterium]|nr:undecaprenyl-diphosphate phosphatase [Spirochaetia bacterium]
MNYVHAVIMGLIQGLTEFFPISSSAHLVLYPKLFASGSALLNSLSFDVALHAGTLAALVIFFWKQILRLLGAFFRGLAGGQAAKSADFKMALYIAAATVPAVFAGYFFGDYIEAKTRNPVFIGAVLIVFGLFLYAADRAGTKRKTQGAMNLADALLIGTAQALALIPGVSRSGITITTGLLAGYRREAAAEFSFILSIPAVFGAFAMQARNIMNISGGEIMVTLSGFMAAAVSGLIAIKVLLDFVKNHNYTVFAAYRLILGAAIIIIFLEAK